MAASVRHVVVVCLVLAAGVLGCASVASAAAVSPRIAGGDGIPISDAPWQVGILFHNVASAYQAQFCGGAILDARRIITAAHCLDADPADGVVDAAGTRDVVAGMTDLKGLSGPPGQRVRIEAWTSMPGHDLGSGAPGPYDVAVATLEAPGLDLSSPNARPATLVGAGVLTQPGTTVRVSGWGATETGTYPSALQAVELLTVSDTNCADFFGADLDPATMLCAIAPGKDSCSGDSGGPLTLTNGTLVGLVSWGPDPCADPSGAPGVYTELAEPAIAAFVRAPQSLSAPVLSGIAKSGEQLTCQPGTWASTVAGSPESDFRFVTSAGQGLRDWSSDATYTLQDTDTGRRVVCLERVRDASGEATAGSAASDPVVGPPAPPTPTPQPGAGTTGTATPAPAPAATGVRAPLDTLAPRTTFVSIRCRARRCVVRVRVADRGTPISGVKTVRITSLPARGAVRTVTAKRIATGIYEARFTRVARGTAWFSVATRDVAGNRSAQPALRNARVR